MADHRNTLALVAAAATLALVLGFAYGATFNGGCEQIKDAQCGCLEWWFSRYQTLIAMFGAIFVAWLSVQPVLKQLKLSSVQTAVALQQVHADREKRLENWLKPELAALEKLSEDLARGYYEREDDHGVLPHWVWDMNQTVDSTRGRLIRRQDRNFGPAEITAARQNLIDILGRLTKCMSDYNGSVYADDPEYDFSDDDRAKIDAAETKAREYPSEADRRTYIAAKISGAKPSYGHIALATLMKGARCRLVWTSNFDPLVADGCAKVYGGTGQLTTVAIETGSLGRNAIDEGRWPVEVKLHGDFRSRRLKNTGDELREQDAKLRTLLIDSCSRWGLVVAGYSGRDESVMDTLEAALERDASFPAGLFWLHRGEDPPLLRVQRLLAAAARKEIDCGLVPIENFDETLRDLMRLVPDLDTTVLDEIATERRVWSPAPRPTGNRGYPVVRLNALELTGMPSVCRRAVCDAGGVAEIKSAIEASGLPVIGTRSKAGVLAFGADADIRAVLSAYEIESFDLHSIETRRLRYDSHERGLLREALTRALTREHRMIAARRRGADLLTPTSVDDEKWAPLRKLTGSLGGLVPKQPELKWKEGVGIRLDWVDERLWLLLEPRTVFEGLTRENRAAATDFARERIVRRYNPALNALLEFWSMLFASPQRDLPALGISTGVNAAFRLGDVTAFSGRARA